jgi:hypothetical protein
MPLAQGIRRGQNHILNFYSSVSITFPSHIAAISFTYFAQMSSNFSSQYNPEVATEPCINPQNDRLPQKQQDSSPVSAHKRWSLPKDKDSHKNFIDHGCRLHPKGYPPGEFPWHSLPSAFTLLNYCSSVGWRHLLGSAKETPLVVSNLPQQFNNLFPATQHKNLPEFWASGIYKDCKCGNNLRQKVEGKANLLPWSHVMW